MTITGETLSEGLMMFYLTTAILLLAVAIVIYPTLKERAKKSSKK